MSPEAEAILGQAMRLTAAAEMAARARVERAEGPPSPRRPSPPIVVGGMLYPSIAAAVSALGLTAQKVRRALDLGKLDQLAPGLRAKPVEIKGRIFASRTIAARVAGVARSTVSGMAARGRADRVGIGTGTLQRKPVEIGGVVYPSMAEAARQLGLAYATIKSAARRGRLDTVGTAATKPVTIRGVRYASRRGGGIGRDEDRHRQRRPRQPARPRRAAAQRYEARMMDGMKPCVDCDRPVMRGRGRRCAACGSRSDRARMVEWLAGRDPYLVALDDSKFCARLDRRIAAESVFDPKTGCRLWRGATNGYGYGQINFRGVLLGVPRLVAIRAERAKPEDPETRHSCDTPACIAPEHLVGGTPAKNARDRAVRNRSPLPNSGLRGVTFVADGRPNPWQAHVCVAGKGHYMGSFADPEMAAARVLGARKCLGLGT